MTRPLRTVLATMTLASAALAHDSLPKLTFNGWAWLTIGQVVSSVSEKSLGQVYDFEFDDEWLVNFEAGFKVTAPIMRHSKGRLHVMTSLQYPVLRNETGLSTAEPVIRRFSIALLDATLQSNWRVFGRDTLETEFGYLPVKYNPQSRNLGEYLFRSGTYPGYLVSGFELADKVKLAGVHVSYRMNAWGTLRQDLYFTNDIDAYPVHDFSLSYLAGFRTPRGGVDAGAGLCAAHLIVVDEKKTTPARNTEKYPIPGDPHAYYVDTLPPYDTTELTFRGTKAMGRLCLDPKVLLPGKFFGPEDLKVYGEVAVLGVKNYNGWYENRSERIPVMVGVNLPNQPFAGYGTLAAVEIASMFPGFFRDELRIPTHRAAVVSLLSVALGSWALERFLKVNVRPDLLSLEVEWYGMKYWNTPEFVWRESTPRPYTGSTAVYGYDWTPKVDDDWRWSIYAAKKIGPIRVSLQVASDHLSRLPWVPSQYPKYTEVCTRSKDWYWMGRVMWMF